MPTTKLPNSSGSPGQIPGTATNDNAAAGAVGEYITATASAVSIPTSATPANICQMILTAGDWDVSGIIGVAASGPNLLSIQAGSSIVSATQGALGTAWSVSAAAFTSQFGAIPVNRLSLSATTTVYAVATATFATGTATGAAVLRARRVR